MLLANLLEPCEKHASFPIFLIMYIGGSSLHYIAGSLYLQCAGPRWLLDMSEGMGCRGGLVTLLAFLSRLRPQERFRFSFWMIEIPRPLTPVQNIVATAAVDAFFAGRGGRTLLGEFVGHFVAFAVG